MGLAAAMRRIPKGCSKCNLSGYVGRSVLSELLVPEKTALGRAILSREASDSLELLAIECGFIPLRQRAAAAVEQGLTSDLEVHRVLGASRIAAHGESIS